MPGYWLAKSEPDVFSIDDMAREERTFWNGVRNYAARGHLRAMRKGDLVLFYHSNADPSAVVGVVRVLKEATPDPTQFDASLGEDMGYDPKSTRDDPRWFGVDVEFVEKLPRPVTLQDVKADPRLKDMKLLKVARLSVSPVTAAEWRVVLSLARGGAAPSGGSGTARPPRRKGR